MGTKELIIGREGRQSCPITAMTVGRQHMSLGYSGKEKPYRIQALGTHLVFIDGKACSTGFCQADSLVEMGPDKVRLDLTSAIADLDRLNGKPVPGIPEDKKDPPGPGKPVTPKQSKPAKKVVDAETLANLKIGYKRFTKPTGPVPGWMRLVSPVTKGAAVLLLFGMLLSSASMFYFLIPAALLVILGEVLLTRKGIRGNGLPNEPVRFIGYVCPTFPSREMVDDNGDPVPYDKLVDGHGCSLCKHRFCVFNERYDIVNL